FSTILKNSASKPLDRYVYNCIKFTFSIKGPYCAPLPAPLRPCVRFCCLNPKSEIPYPKSGALAMTTTASTLRPWIPSDRDRIIYRWVKFDGHKQSWVADQLGMNQSTVSRIVDRYERWVAHGGPAQQGALNRDERLRAQVWLTYERNESIIASCMRLAGEME